MENFNKSSAFIDRSFLGVTEKMRISVDNLLIYDADLQFFADRFTNQTGSNSATHAVKNMDDLQNALNNYNSVKFLEIALHGKPGKVFLQNQTEIVGTYLNKMMMNPNFLQKNSRILFDSCQIGAGDAGDKFMDSIGAGMLKGKGGIVGATTVDNASYPFFPWVTGAYMTSGGQLKIKKYDTDGKLIAETSVKGNGVSSYL